MYQDPRDETWGKTATKQTIDVVDMEGKKVGEEKLKMWTFSRQTANYVVHQAYCVWVYQQMPFKKFVPRRSDVRKGPKPWKQKGSGRARHGSFYSPLFGKSATNKAPHGLDGKAQKKVSRHKHMGSISTVLQSKWRGMVIVDGLEDWKEPNYSKMAETIEKVTNWPAGKVRTLLISRNGYGELDMDIHSPTPVSRLNPIYMSGRLIPKFAMRRPRDIDMMADGLHQLLVARKIIITREAFFDLCAKFNAENGWQWIHPERQVQATMRDLAEDYPCDRKTEIEAASKLPVDADRRQAWAVAERAKMGFEEVPAVSMEEA
jgi:large subunit ribosomal protein L4